MIIVNNLNFWGDGLTVDGDLRLRWRKTKFFQNGKQAYYRDRNTYTLYCFHIEKAKTSFRLSVYKRPIPVKENIRFSSIKRYYELTSKTVLLLTPSIYQAQKRAIGYLRQDLSESAKIHALLKEPRLVYPKKN